MAWYIPLLIFFARVCDVSLGTVRTILTVSGHRAAPALLGFAEVVIWTLAISGVIRFLDNPWALMGYAGGFACGVFVGTTIEDKIALGYRVVRAISRDVHVDVPSRLREAGWSVTRVAAHGKSGPVDLAFMVIRRRDLRRLIADVARIDDDAFVTVERADRPSGGTFAQDARTARRPWLRFGQLRK